MPEPALAGALQVQNERVIEADRRPGILARMLGSMLKTAYLGRGMHLEFRHPDYKGPIVTSPMITASGSM